MEGQQAKFYDGSGVRGYNAFISMCSGARGIGKSFDWLNFAANDFEKTGNKFSWVRRTETEIYGDSKTGKKGCAEGFGDNVSEVYPRKKFTIRGEDILLNGKKAGEFVPLSSAIAQKGRQRKIKDLLPNMIFDEFLIDDASHHYLGGMREPTTLFGLYQSLARPDGIRGTGDSGRIVMLSNSTTFANPYYLYFNIKPFKGRYYYDKNRDILVEVADNKAFRDKMLETRFGRALSDTPYADYAFDNKMLFDNDDFIVAKKPPKSRYLFGIRYNKQELGFWADYENGVYWIGSGAQAVYPLFAVTKDDMTYNTLLLRNPNRTMFAEFIYGFESGSIGYENTVAKSIAYDVACLFCRK